jgi:D-tyrosyl-tRNA(Tyr) deacylase
MDPYRDRMRAVVQRAARARVTFRTDQQGDYAEAGAIGRGLCVLIGATHDDTEAAARKLAHKVAKLRIFNDDDHKMNHSVLDVDGEVLVVSQFTLYGDAAKGNRPSYVDAARPEVAEPLVDAVVDELRSLGLTVATGRFRTDMQVELVNDGPVTIALEVPTAGRTPS